MWVRKERFLGWDALVLAGGASRRMGRDKAALRVDGMPLLEVQLRRARAAGARELWVSCGVGGPPCDPGVEGVHWLIDPEAGRGPWPGLLSALRECHAGALMVLAVDLPALTQGFLKRLLESSGPGKGCVPLTSGGLEPLCALYPVPEARVDALHLDTAGKGSPRALVLRGIEAGWMQTMPISIGDGGPLLNWNHPDDWPPDMGKGG